MSIEAALDCKQDNAEEPWADIRVELRECHWESNERAPGW